MNKKFQAALNNEAQECPPIWMMRQAGRYHSHYQERRKKHRFEELCKSPDLAAEVALGPIEEFDFDVSILFSDILFPLEALGIPLQYNPAPELGWSLSQDTFQRLEKSPAVIDKLGFQSEALRKTRELLPKDKSLIGFVGGPWTLFSYAVEGSHKGGLIEAKKNLNLFPKFLELLLPLLAENIKMQAAAGAEVVMVFDTAAGEVSPGVFKKWLAPALSSLVEMTAGIRLGYYSKSLQKGYIECLPEFSGLGFDHHFQMSEVLKGFQGDSFFKQGNFDQALLHLSREDFAQELEAWLRPIRDLSVEERRGWVCGLGHGVLPKTPEANVKEFVQFVRAEFQ